MGRIKYVVRNGNVYKLTKWNYFKALEAIAAREELDMKKVGAKRIGAITDITNVGPEEAKKELEAERRKLDKITIRYNEDPDGYIAFDTYYGIGVEGFGKTIEEALASLKAKIEKTKVTDSEGDAIPGAIE